MRTGALVIADIVEDRMAWNMWRGVAGPRTKPVLLSFRDRHVCGLDLSNVDFTHMDLTGTTFEECKLSRASFHVCRLEATTFNTCDLSGAVLYKLYAPGVRFESCKLDDTTFGTCYMPEGRVTHCDAKCYLRFDNCDLDSVRFDSSILVRACFEQCNMTAIRSCSTIFAACKFSNLTGFEILPCSDGRMSYGPVRAVWYPGQNQYFYQAGCRNWTYEEAMHHWKHERPGTADGPAGLSVAETIKRHHEAVLALTPAVGVYEPLNVPALREQWEGSRCEHLAFWEQDPADFAALRSDLLLYRQIAATQRGVVDDQSSVDSTGRQ